MDNTNLIEKWEKVKGYEELYEVSSFGLVRSIGFNNTLQTKELKQKKRDGSFAVTFSLKGKTREIKVHIVVATSFIKNPNKFQHVKHLDGNKENNKFENLEWIYTPKNTIFHDSNGKECSVCKKYKLFDEFIKRNNRSSGRQSYCNDCHKVASKTNYTPYLSRLYDVKRTYGLSADQYKDLYEKHNSSCAICHKSVQLLSEKKRKNLCIDHCHVTGKIRGLLCTECNAGIGFLGDNIDILKSAVTYLEKHL